MAHRSPARFLAPLALVGFAVALVLVIGASTGGDDEQPAAPTPTVDRTAERTEEREDARRDGRRRRRPRTYTVEPGDTPSGIAEKTGVSLEQLEEANPDLDPQLLAPGQRIKIPR